MNWPVSERRTRGTHSTSLPPVQGHDRSVDIIDCEKQVTYKMTLEEYIEYFESFERNKIYNVLSLEISDTKYVGKPRTAPGSPCLTRSDAWITRARFSRERCYA